MLDSPVQWILSLNYLSQFWGPLQIDLKGFVWDIAEAVIRSILEYLRKVTADMSLVLRGFWPGSIRLIFEGSSEAYNRLYKLCVGGSLKTIEGFDVTALADI